MDALLRLARGSLDKPLFRYQSLSFTSSFLSRARFLYSLRRCPPIRPVRRALALFFPAPSSQQSHHTVVRPLRPRRHRSYRRLALGRPSAPSTHQHIASFPGLRLVVAPRAALRTATPKQTASCLSLPPLLPPPPRSSRIPSLSRLAAPAARSKQHARLQRAPEAALPRQYRQAVFPNPPPAHRLLRREHKHKPAPPGKRLSRHGRPR